MLSPRPDMSLEAVPRNFVPKTADDTAQHAPIAPPPSLWFAGEVASTGRAFMDVRAAVASEPGKPLAITHVNLDGPRAGEVMVEIKATGICHTDEFTLSGKDPEGLFPAILGHEGAGVVVEVGPGVTSLKQGDHVIPLYTPESRECEYFLAPKTHPGRQILNTHGARE